MVLPSVEIRWCYDQRSYSLTYKDGFHEEVLGNHYGYRGPE